MTWETLLAILGALGGLELIKFIANRRTNGRVEEAKADNAELELLMKHQEFSDKQIAIKDEHIQRCQEEIDKWEERYNTQTERLRKTQDELLATQKEKADFELKYQHSKMWECQLADCKKRVPSNPALWGTTYAPLN